MNPNYATNPAAFNNFGPAHKDSDPTPHGPGAADVVTFTIGDEIPLNGLPAFGGGFKQVLLPPGYYNFEVKQANLDDYIPAHEGGAIPPCPKVSLRLAVTTKDGDKVSVFDNLFICAGLKNNWAIRKIRDFYCSIGALDPKAETLKFDLNILGRTGRAKIGINEYNGKKRNQIEGYVAMNPKDPPAGVNMGNNTDLPF